MSSSALPYLLLFLPLIASVFCFLVNFKKTNFLIFIATVFILLVLATKLSVDFSVSGEIKTDFSLDIVSILTEYRLDFLALFFLLITLSSQILIAFLYRLDLFRAFNKDNYQPFYSVWLLNIFGIIGIFTTNNIFNLFIFIEIYCLTFCAIMAMSDDLELSKLAFKYFCNSALGAILMSIALILIYASGKIFQIDQIDSSLFLKSSNPISWLVVIAIALKFFPINLYFHILKSCDQLANLLLNFTFIINIAVGFYLLLRVLLLLFGDNEVFFQFAIVLGCLLVFYSNYKMFRTLHLKDFTSHLLLANVGFVFITFLLDKSSLSSLFYVANYILSGLVLFFIVQYLAKHRQIFQTKSLNQNSNWQNSNWQNKIIIAAIVLIISNLPLTLIFWANWHLALMFFNANMSGLLIVPILSTNFALVNFQLRLFAKNLH